MSTTANSNTELNSGICIYIYMVIANKKTAYDFAEFKSGISYRVFWF